jgi:hypothetical protein
MSVAQTLTAELAEIGESKYSETKQTPGRKQFSNQLLGDIGSEGISDPTYQASNARLIRRGKQRRPKGYWQKRMSTSGLNYSQEQMAEATLNVSDPTADVAAMQLDSEEDDAALFRKKIEDRYQNKLDQMQAGMTATTGNSIYQIEDKTEKLKDRLRTELP